MTCQTCTRYRVKLARDEQDVVRLARVLAADPDNPRAPGRLRAAQSQRDEGRRHAAEHAAEHAAARPAG